MCDESDPVINDRRLSELKVVELKEELGKRGLSKIGNKNVLYDRLKEFLNDETGAAEDSGPESATESPKRELGSPPANPLVAEYLAKQQAALLEARKDAEAVRRAASGDEGSPSNEREGSRPKRGKRKEADSALEKTLPARSTRNRARSAMEQQLPADDVEVNGKEKADQQAGDEERGAKEEEENAKEIEIAKDMQSAIDNEVGTDARGGIFGDKAEAEVRCAPLVKEVALEKKSESADEEEPGGDQGKKSVESCKSDEDREEATREMSDDAPNESEAEFKRDVDVPKELLASECISATKEVTTTATGESRGSNIAVEKSNTVTGQGSKKAVEDIAKVSVPEPKQISDDDDDEEVQEDRKNEDLVEVHASSSSPASTSTTSRKDDSELKEPISTENENVVTQSEGSVVTEDLSEHSPPPSTDVEDGIPAKAEPERKRRWKDTSRTDDSIDVGVVTVSVTETALPLETKAELHVESGEEEAVEAESSFSGKDELTELKDRPEELDYEEHVESAKISKNEREQPFKRSRKQSSPKAAAIIRHERADENAKKHSQKADESNTSENRVTPEGFVRRHPLSPARYPVSQVLLIRQLTRPFTVKQLQQLLGTFGTIVEGGFWIDAIKSTCIVKYSSMEEAVIARGRLHNVVWPSCSPKALKVDYLDDAGLQKHIEEKSAAANQEKDAHAGSGNETSLRMPVAAEKDMRHGASSRAKHDDHLRSRDSHTQSNSHHSYSPQSKRERSRDKRSPLTRGEERKRHSSPEPCRKESVKKIKTADELFNKTKAQPSIYYLPLTEAQALERAKRKAAEIQLAASKKDAEGMAKRKKSDDGKTEKPEQEQRRTPPPPTRARSPEAPRRHRSPHSKSPRRKR